MEQTIKCPFCGRDNTQVDILVTDPKDPDSAICDECIRAVATLSAPYRRREDV